MMRQSFADLTSPIMQVRVIPLVLIIAFHARATDWPQFLGPERNGTYPGSAISTSWPKEGPARLWQRSIGQGFSAPTVMDSKLIVFHRLGDKEVVESLNAGTGRPVWKCATASSRR